MLPSSPRMWHAAGNAFRGAYEVEVTCRAACEVGMPETELERRVDLLEKTVMGPNGLTEQVAQLRADVGGIRTDLSALRGEFLQHRAETRGEFVSFRQEVKDE